jgi:phosphatidylserine synthase
MFMRWRYLYLLLSACVIVPGLVCLARFGLRTGEYAEGAFGRPARMAASARVIF